MSDLQRWRDSGHLERGVGTAGGQEEVHASRSADMWRLGQDDWSPSASVSLVMDGDLPPAFAGAAEASCFRRDD
jgi:hypothetical protein